MKKGIAVLLTLFLPLLSFAQEEVGIDQKIDGAF